MKKAITCLGASILFLFSFVVVYGCGNNEGNVPDINSSDIKPYIIFTDTATKATYKRDYSFADGEDVHIPYDGVAHCFEYRFYNSETDEQIGKAGWISNDYKGKTICEPDYYLIRVTLNYADGKVRDFDLRFYIDELPKLQPEMKFDPNGAIEYIDGEYYKYKYTGDKCYPKAYAEYDGHKIEVDGAYDALIVGCHNLAISGISIAAPINVGVYSVEFSIIHYKNDEDLNKYYSVKKTITVEVVE